MIIELALLSSMATYWVMGKKKSQPKKATLDNNQFSLTQFAKDVKTAVMGDERQNQLVNYDSEMSQEMQQMQQNVNKDMLISAFAVTTALLAPLSPLFALTSAATVLYLSRRVFALVWRDFKAGHFLSMFLIGAIMVVGMIATGHLVLAALAGLVGGFFVKIIERTEHHSKKQLVNVFGGHPPRVWVIKNNVEIEVEFAQLQVGDLVVINAGEIIPIDGIIEEGLATVDQHLLTGESQPVEKAMGDKVFAATLLLSGRIKVRVETTGEKTVAAQIGQVLDHTQHYKDELMSRGRKIADKLLPLEFGIGVVTWFLMGSSAALTVLWAALGANMVSLGPLTVLSYLQILSRRGILVKDGRVLESLRQVNTIVFDKTGTLTLEQPTVGQVYCVGNWDESTVLTYAAAAEYRQPHPIAKAIVERAAQDNLVIPQLDEACYEVGYGIKVLIDNCWVRVGSARFMSREGIVLPIEVSEIQSQAAEMGYSLIYVSIDQELAGILEMQPTLRPETQSIIHYLKQKGMELYIISGDHEHPTRRMAETLGIDHYFAEVLPENKASLVKELREQGRFVCFIGDGINDAIALKSAQISISLKGASTAATDTAQIILMHGTLHHLPLLFQLADEFEETMHTNLLTSIVPGVICIGGVYFLHFTLAMGMGLFYAGSAVGLSNTLLPLIKHQEPTSEMTAK